MSDQRHTRNSRNSVDAPLLYNTNQRSSTSNKQDWAKPALTSGESVGTRRTATKKRRPHSTSHHRRKSAKPVEAVSTTEPVEASAQAEAQVKLLLRPFTPEDETVVVRLTQEEIAPVYRETYGQDLDMAQVIQYVHNAQTRMILADDEVIGYVSAVAGDTGVMNVGSLILTGTHQGKGYGKRIMKQLEQEAQAMGMRELEAFIQQANTRSQAFVKSLGFTEGQSFNPKTIVVRKPLA